MSKGGRYLKKKTVPAGRRRKTALVIVSIIVVLFLAVGAFGVSIYNTVLDNINRAEVIEKDVTMNEELEQMMGNIEETTLPPETTEEVTVPTTLAYTPSEQDVINILVIGQAARGGEEYRMADTMILVTVNKQTKTITATSFLRDAYVKLPNYMGHTCGRNRINVCYHLGWTWGDTGGAMEMTSLCLLNNFGVEVDHCIEVDFEAFVKIINLLGGVELELTEAEADYINKEHAKAKQEVTPGKNLLKGKAALVYARMRKAEGDSDSDIKRTSRQRYLLEELLKKVKNDGFDKLMEMAEEVLPMITTDMTNDEITTCLWELLPLLPELKFETGTCPVEDSYWGEVIDILGMPSSVIKYDEYKNRLVMTALTEGTQE